MRLETGSFLKVSEVANGDQIIFLDEGDWVESVKYTYDDGTPRKDFVIKVSYKGAEKKMRLNKTNRDSMVAAYGDDTLLWINKKATISKEKVMVAGKRMDTIVLSSPDANKSVQDLATEDEQDIPF